MQINNITVPDAGTTIELIPDVIGGWVYTVTTNVSVEQRSINSIKAELQSKKEIAAATKAEAERFEDEIKDFVEVIKTPEPEVIEEPVIEESEEVVVP